MEIGVYHEFHCRPDQTAAAAYEEAVGQIEEIKRGLAEADAGEFATDAEAEATFENWQHLKCDAD